MTPYEENQIKRNITLLEYIFKSRDIYGCDIILKSKAGVTDYLIVTDEQVQILIDSYYKRLGGSPTKYKEMEETITFLRSSNETYKRLYNEEKQRVIELLKK